MAEENKKAKVDWEKIEPHWRAGIRTKLSISKEFGVSRAAMDKHFDSLGIERDLSAKIKAKAESLVAQAQVTKEVTQERLRVTETDVVDANATAIAVAILDERADMKRARATVNKLWDRVDAELDHPAEMENLGELMRSPDETGKDRLSEMYQAAISLPQQIKNVKALVEALKILIELERKVLKLDNDDANDFAKKFGEGVAMGAADAYAKMLNG